MTTLPPGVAVLAGVDDQGDLSVALTVGTCEVRLTKDEAKHLGMTLLVEAGGNQAIRLKHHQLGQEIARLHAKGHAQGLAPDEEAAIYAFLLVQVWLEQALKEGGGAPID